MNAQDQAQHKEQQDHIKRRDSVVEHALHRILKTKHGRTAIAFIVRGTHNLGHVYTPGMTFDQVAFEAGKQYDGRELIRIIRRTQRCSDLFDQAIREYEHEWSSSAVPRASPSAGTD